MYPHVVKIGGSLLGSVEGLAEVISSFSREPILVVPGGGPFADHVRSLAVSEEASHWMAIAAMEQYGWYIASFGLEVTEELEIPTSPRVLLPYQVMRERDPLPHTWDVTSDTIAAWIASALQADLVLLKSVDGLFRKGILQHQVREVFSCDEVDPFFLPYVFSHRVRCIVLNGTTPRSLREYLGNSTVRGTRVETTF